MDNTQQLPAEVLKEVTSKAEAAYLQLDTIVSDIDCNFGLPMFEKKLGPIEEVITEYATMLHQAQQENEDLKQRLTISDAACSVLNEQEKTARTLLQKFISRHEAGLLPDRFIYDEIKQFLK